MRCWGRKCQKRRCEILPVFRKMHSQVAKRETASKSDSILLRKIRYIVDTGREKRRKYRAASGVSSFVVDKVSKALASDSKLCEQELHLPDHVLSMSSSLSLGETSV